MLNLALRKPALQSSVSAYSIGSTPAEDARGANNGQLSGRYGFHTQTERDPWWQVDIEDSFLISRVVVFNRPQEAGRLRHFSILGSRDGQEWETLFRKTDDRVFGESGEPFTAEIAVGLPARYVRIRLDGEAPLHFDECQVFGEHPDPAVRTRMQAEEKQAERLRGYIRDGRHGRVVDIDGLAVFVDEESYGDAIIRLLESSDYERPERQLVGQLVTHVDRIVDVGTGLGLVAMIAARIAGPESVVTFDANPDIVGDARDNFERSGLSGIRSYVGVPRNRRAISDPNGTVTFHLSKHFWASRVHASPTDRDIVGQAQVPIFCLEDAIENHRATVLICDLEGAEVELLSDADLSGIRLIIMETHYWAAGEAPTDEMVRKLIMNGFSIHLGASRGSHLALRRHKIR